MGMLGSTMGAKPPVSTDTLNKDELEHLLWALSESTFRGKDVHLLSGIINKLANQLKSK